MRPCGFCANHHHRYCHGGLCSCALVKHDAERFNADDRAYVAAYTDPRAPVDEAWPRWVAAESRSRRRLHGPGRKASRQ